MKSRYLMIILIACVFISACATVETDKKYSKVILIGIDGADPRVLSQLMDEGKLPNFAKLRDTGTFTNLKTSMPPHSPVAWTTIATGTNPGEHNIFDFINRDPKTYMPSLALSKVTTTHLGGTKYESIVSADPFWRTSSSEGIPTSVLRWPVTFPPEKVEGHLLSGLGVTDVRGLLSGYSYYTTEKVKDSPGPENLVQVEIKDSLIETVVYGPRKRQGNNIVDVTAPMNVKIQSDEVVITVSGTDYVIKKNGWSDWIRIKFKVGIAKEVSGIAKAYLVSLNPFKLYLTAVQIDPKKPLYDISYPSEYAAELAESIGTYHTLGIAEDTGALNDKKIDEKTFLEQAMQIEEEREKMFWQEFKETDKGVFAFVFDTIDRIQHMFWQEDVFSGNFSIAPEVEAYFAKKDKFIGKLLDEIKQDTALIIVSDHGFTSFQRAVSVNRWLVDNGFMTLTQEPAEGEDGGLFQYVDWSKTKAYSLGFNSIYINLEGREDQGVVKQEEKHKIEQEIMDKLLELTDSKTGKKPIYRLYRGKEIYTGDKVKDGPDIMIGYGSGYRTSWQTAIGGLTKDIIFDNEKHWKADHLVDTTFVPGILLANFKITKENPEQQDIAPTMLALLYSKSKNKIYGRSLIR